MMAERAIELTEPLLSGGGGLLAQIKATKQVFEWHKSRLEFPAYNTLQAIVDILNTAEYEKYKQLPEGHDIVEIHKLLLQEPHDNILKRDVFSLAFLGVRKLKERVAHPIRHKLVTFIHPVLFTLLFSITTGLGISSGFSANLWWVGPLVFTLPMLPILALFYAYQRNARSRNWVRKKIWLNPWLMVPAFLVFIFGGEMLIISFLSFFGMLGSSFHVGLLMFFGLSTSATIGVQMLSLAFPIIFVPVLNKAINYFKFGRNDWVVPLKFSIVFLFPLLVYASTLMVGASTEAFSVFAFMGGMGTFTWLGAVWAMNAWGKTGIDGCNARVQEELDAQSDLLDCFVNYYRRNELRSPGSKGFLQHYLLDQGEQCPYVYLNLKERLESKAEKGGLAQNSSEFAILQAMRSIEAGQTSRRPAEHKRRTAASGFRGGSMAAVRKGLVFS